MAGCKGQEENSGALHFELVKWKGALADHASGPWHWKDPSHMREEWVLRMLVFSVKFLESCNLCLCNCVLSYMASEIKAYSWA